jgi:hypothetical protein
LLDLNLNLELVDFQDQKSYAYREIILDGLFIESTMAYLPRKPADHVSIRTDHASIRTDQFDLGSTICLIIMGQEVFSELDGSKDKDKTASRFCAREYPASP